MKKTLFMALAAAVALTACESKPAEQPVEVIAEEKAQEAITNDIAYIQVEAVLAQSDLYKNEGAALQEKTQKAQKSWAQKEKNLQAEAAALQEKYQKGLITTIDAQNQQQSIEKRIAAYQSSAQKEAQALDEENFVFTNRAQDLLHRAVDRCSGCRSRSRKRRNFYQRVTAFYNRSRRYGTAHRSRHNGRLFHLLAAHGQSRRTNH